MIETSEAIVLQYRRFGDTSKIINLYSLMHGLISVIAKGALQSKSKFGASLELFCCSSITFYNKPKHDLHLLSNSEILVPIRHLHTSLEHFIAAMLTSETVLYSQEHVEANSDIYELLKQTLITLNKIQANPYSIFFNFAFRLADYMGFGLNIDDLKNSNGIIFSIRDGNFVNEQNNFANHLFNFQNNLKNTFIKLCNHDNEAISAIQLASNEIISLLNFTIDYFSFHLEKKFKYKAMDLINI